jgi:acetyl esterase/lipase
VAIGYLIPVVLIAWCTGCALWPTAGGRRFGVIAFRYGLAVSELPFLAMYLLAAVTLLTWAQGDLASATGLIGLVLSVVCVVGLATLVRRATRARGVLDRALQESLGDDPVVAGRPAGTRLARVLVSPLGRRRRDVERVANLSYGDAGSLNSLDVYRRRSHPAGCPVFIHLHGGRFVGGRKDRESLPLLYQLAGHGWLCISANYRLAPAATFPDPVIDLKRVLAWVREHGQSYGADPSRLVVAGSSAGAHIAVTAALTPNRPELQPGFESCDTSVAAVVGLGGYYGPADGVRAETSPAGYVTADAPPCFLVHGELDSVVSAGHAREFAATMRATSTGPVGYAELPGGQHAFDLFHSIRFDATVDAVEAFVTRAVRPHDRAPR